MINSCRPAFEKEQINTNRCDQVENISWFIDGVLESTKRMEGSGNFDTGKQEDEKDESRRMDGNQKNVDRYS